VSRRKGQTGPRTVCLGLRARAWWVMRKNRRFTLPDLLTTLADGTQKEPAGNLGRYLRHLARAGILEIETERVSDGKLTSNGLLSYRLIKDVGPKAPVVRQDGVYDPNAGALYSTVREEQRS
jgi:hypothetical protein